MTDLQTLWSMIKADLQRARHLLPNSGGDSSSLLRHEELVGHNELELACDALEDSAKDCTVSRDFWPALRDAASKMHLEEDAARYQDHAERF